MVFFALVKTGPTRQLSPSPPSSFRSAALPNAAAPRGTGRRSPSRKLAGREGRERTHGERRRPLPEPCPRAADPPDAATSIRRRQPPGGRRGGSGTGRERGRRDRRQSEG